MRLRIGTLANLVTPPPFLLSHSFSDYNCEGTIDLPRCGASSHLLTILCVLISLIHDLLVYFKNGTVN